MTRFVGGLLSWRGARKAVLAALLVYNGFSFAQCGGATWQYTFAGPGDDVSHRVVHHPNGDNYVAGFTDSFSSDYDLFLARYTNDTVLVWAKTYDLFGDDGGWSINFSVGPSGNLYLAATLNGIATSQEDGSLMKLDPDGMVLWARRIMPMSGYAQGRAVLEAPDGSVFLAGSTNSLGNGVDAYAARFTSDGMLVWLYSYGGSDFDHFTHINRLADGSLVAGSQTASFGTSTRKGFVAHLDENGGVIGAVQHGGPVYDDYNHSCRNPDGTFLRIGFTNSYGPGARDVLAVLTDSIGSVIWSRAYGTVAGNELGMNAVPDASGGWFLMAYRSSDRQAHLLHVQADGDLDWTRAIDGLFLNTTASWNQPLELLPSGDLLVVGSTNGSGNGDMRFVKLDPCGETSCGMSDATWGMTVFDIAEQIIPLAISASSTNVTSISVVVSDITGQVEQVESHVECACVVELSSSAISACLGEEVHLDLGVDSALASSLIWTWDLGDGTSSTEPGALDHAYYSVGVYMVQISATSANGDCMDSAVIQVEVADVEQPDLGPNLLICPGMDVELQAQPADPNVGVLWSDGSGGFAMTVGQGGSYWVSYEMSGCTRTDTLVIEDVQLPVLDLGPDTSICSGGDATFFVDSSWMQVFWSDGSSGVSMTTDTAGLVVVYVSLEGCALTDSVQVALIVPPYVDIGPDQVACLGAVVELSTGIPGLPHSWQDGTTTFFYDVTVSGVYWVEVGAAGCSGRDSVVVDFIPLPSIDLGADTSLCDGYYLTLGPVSGDVVTWSDGSEGPTLVVGSEGLYWVAVTEQGCTAIDSLFVDEMEYPWVELGSDTTVCDGEPVMLVSESLNGVLLAWSTGATTESISAATTGLYWVEAYNSCGTASDSIHVQVTGPLQVDLGPDTLVCGEVVLQVGSGYPASMSLWSDGALSSTINLSQPGTYWVLVTEGECTASDTIVVSQDDFPIMILSPDTLLCDPGQFILTPMEWVGDYVLWSDGTTSESYFAQEPGSVVAITGNSCGFASDTIVMTWTSPFHLPQDVRTCFGDEARVSLPDGVTSVLWSNGSSDPVQYLSEGSYTVQVVDAFGCPRAGEINVVVDSGSDGLLYVPNVFTPNNDRVNDVFSVQGAEWADFALSVFNRWGELIFESNDPAASWDGTYRGSYSPDGTYVYVVKYRTSCLGDSMTHEVFGHVTLLR